MSFIKPNRIFKLTLFTIFIFSINYAFTQTITLLKDINPGSSGSLLKAPNVVRYFKNHLYFVADDGVHGAELWKTESDSAFLFVDINPGAEGSGCQNFYILGDKLIFTADDGTHGLEWWVTDGTVAGTEMIKDLNPGSSSGIFTSSFEEGLFHMYKNEVFFTGNSSGSNYFLWKTDGTTDGTVLVKDLLFPEKYEVFKDELYFGGRNGLWKTDGTSAGTILVRDNDPDNSLGLRPNHLLSMGDYLLFFTDNDLWKSDGTESGTIELRDFSNVSLNWFGNRITRLGEIALFPGDDGVTGDELWQTDGTILGTKLVVDLQVGSSGYAPQNTVVYRDELYYKGENSDSGIELWATDGTEFGTRLVKDIGFGANSGINGRTVIVSDEDRIYLTAGRAFSQELWYSDGTELGTKEVNINTSDESRPYVIYPFAKDSVFVYAIGENIGFEPYLITFSSVTSVNDVSAVGQDVTIYPNPTNINSIKVSGMTQVSARVYDVSGHVIFNKQNLIDCIYLGEVSPGVYTLELTDESSGKRVIKSLVIE